MTKKCRIDVGILKSEIYFRISGYASFTEAAEISQYLSDLSASQDTRSYSFDLRQCEKMDSTFMGLIARLACESQGNNVQIYFCQGSALKCLEDLGLTLMVKMCDQWEGDPVELAPLSPTQLNRHDKENAIRSSHETLSSLSEENRQRFTDVIESFKSDL